MKRTGILLILAAAVQTLCFAAATNLTPEHRELLEDSSSFHEVRTTTALPAEVVALCADNNGRIADPGQMWEVTDLISDASLPRKRLLWAAVSGKTHVVHYERGGRGHSFHILVAASGANEAEPQVIWRAVGGPFANYTAFLQGLQAGALNDNVAYAH